MTSKDGLSFEQALTELEDIVEKLESGTLSLDETMVLYQRGRDLTGYCQKRLDDMALRVEQLVTNPDGEHEVVPFEAS